MQRMRSRWVAAAVAGGLSALVLGVAAQAAERTARPSARCESPGRLVAATADAAITYHRRGRFGYYGCVRGQPARYLGFFDRSVGGVVLPALGGRYAGFGLRACDRGGCVGRTVLRDLRSGRRFAVELDTPSVRRHRALVVSRRGFVAWGIALSGAAGGGGEIHLLRRGGEHELLDAGAGVDPRSVALGGKRLYWVRDGAVQTRLVE